MELKTYSDILNLHKQFESDFEKRKEDLRKELPKTAEGVITLKRAAIKQALEAAKAAERTRDSLVKRANAQVVQLQGDVARLTREVEQLEGSVKKTPKLSAKAPARRAKPK